MSDDEDLKNSYSTLGKDEQSARRIHNAASLFNHIYGWGLSSEEWQSKQGTQLADELWEFITKGMCSVCGNKIARLVETSEIRIENN